jgi:hypothetical protein
MKRTTRLVIAALLSAGLISGCDTGPDQPAAGNVRPVGDSDLRLTQGQTVFVPAYSEIFAEDGAEVIHLTVTLAIHNTDLDTSIVLRTVRYYDTHGELVRDYLDAPVELGPLATTGYVIEEADTRGGWGSNFVVEWGAETEVYEPVIEAVMLNASFGRSISMISPGRVIAQHLGADDSP